MVVVGHLELWRLLDRPLVLKSLSTLRVVCAALTPATPAPATTYVAHFVAGFAGKMLFRQVCGWQQWAGGQCVVARDRS